MFYYRTSILEMSFEFLSLNKPFDLIIWGNIEFRVYFDNYIRQYDLIFIYLPSYF